MTIAVTSYATAALLFVAFLLVLLSERRRWKTNALLMLAAGATALWSAVIALNGAQDPNAVPARLLELGRNGAWLVFLVGILLTIHGRELVPTKMRSVLVGLAIGIATLALLALADQAGTQSVQVFGVLDVVLAGYLATVIAGLVLVEQVFRGIRGNPGGRYVKYFCFGIGGIFAYDFYLYADALLFQRIDANLWQARGFVNALIVPVLGVAVARNPYRSSGIFLSRKIVFHSTALVASGVYLLLMGAGGYYVREYGGSWGTVAQILLLFGALLVLSILLLSVPLRARLKVLINKHLFHHKYDYREEWLRFIATLSTSKDSTRLHDRAIKAMAQIIESPGGVLWMRRDGDVFEPEAWWNMQPPTRQREPANSALARFLARQQWVINLEEYARDPELYWGLGHLQIPDWLRQTPNAWLVSPLMLEDHLLGFVVLAQRSDQTPDFNWEDCDLLKTAGRQAASHLAQQEASQALAEARRFEEVNRLSAYVVHDLKNLASQLSLVVSNAAKRKNDRHFMEDAIETVEDSVHKMHKLLQHLRDGTAASSIEPLCLADLLEQVVQRRQQAGAQPAPTLECRDRNIYVRSDRDRLAAVLGHVVQNAEDATPADGRITIRLMKDAQRAIIEVEDTGCGMDEVFIRARLFRPFQTTKGASGMGIGVYQVREFVQSLGGHIDVESTPGQGTVFRIHLPFNGSVEDEGQEPLAAKELS